ncbi:flagellar hook-basal body complex protein [Caminibacter sp.]
MTTSFYNGITGMMSFQNGIDTWGNNIANINTVGFKKNIPEFSTIFSQTLKTSPITSDVGLGSTLFSTAKDFSEGSIVESDNPFDMAIVGDAFFKVDDFYTKNGQFDIDKEGYLVDDNGHYLQGVMLYKGESNIVDENLIINENNSVNFDDNTLLTGDLSKIKLPPNLQSPAKVSKNLSLQATLTDKMQNPYLSDENAILGVEYIQKDDKYIPVNIEDGNEIIAGFGDFKIDQNLVYTDITLKEINTPLIIDSVINGHKINLEFTDPSTTPDDVKKAISDELNKYGVRNAITDEGIRICGYNKLIIQSNDSVFKNVAVERISYSSSPTKENEFHTNKELTSILNQLAQNIDTNINITFENGGFKFQNNSDKDITLTMKPSTETIKDFTSIFPKSLTAKTTHTTNQLYLNEQKFSGYYYDEKGDKHPLTFSFLRNDKDKFFLNVLDENDTPLTTQELIYKDNKFTPNTITFNGMTLKLDLTLQNSSLYNTIFSQDGFPKGELERLSIDNNGTIFAYFNNSKEAVLGKIPIFHFQNSQGLSSLGNNLFMESPNSGEKLITNQDFFAQNNTSHSSYPTKIAYIKSGMLEQSNVQLSQAMTELIITQKAFSAAAKTVTTSDEMIQKAINLKR